MFEVGRLVARITLDGAAAFKKELSGLKSEWGNMSDEAVKAGNTVGKAMTGAGVALVGMVALAVNAAIEWETAWTGVTKTVDGTAEELGAVEAGLRNLAKTLPSTHTEIAAVAEAAGQLGVQTGAVVQFTRTMIDLGQTTNLSAEEAASSLAKFSNVMGTSQDKASNLGSAIVELGNNYATTEADILGMATRLSGAAKQVGLSEGQTLGLATALSSVGIEADAGGSAFSKVMIDIASSVDKGGKRVELFAKTAGVSADVFSAKWKKDPGEAMALFVTGLANAESQGKSTFGVLEELGISEVRMRDALLRSASAADKFAGAMKTGDDAFTSNTALAAEAEKRYATVASQITIMGNNVNDAAINFGAVFLPVLSDVVGGLTDFAAFLGGMDPTVQGFIAVVGLGTGAVLLFGGMLLLTVPKIVEFRTASQLLAIQMPKTTGAIAAAGRALTVLGVAVAAAMAVEGLSKALADELNPSAAETTNSLLGAKNATDQFRTALTARYSKDMGLEESTRQLNGMKDALQAAADQSESFWKQPSTSQAEILASISRLGEEYATLAAKDLPAAQDKFRMLAQAQGLNATEQWRLLQNMPAYKEALLEAGVAAGDATDKTGLLEAAFGTAKKSTTEAADAYSVAALEVQGLHDALTTLIDTMAAAEAAGQGSERANATYRGTLADVTKAVEEQIEKNGQNLESIDALTASGSANRDMFVGLAEDTKANAQAQLEYDLTIMSSDEAARAYLGTLGEGKQALYDQILALTGNAESAQALTDKIYAIPNSFEVEAIMETASASRQLDTFIDGQSGRTIWVNVATSYAYNSGSVGGIPTERGADGFVLESYADGGVREHHVAQIAKAGTWRVWAEDETEGEAYIPLAESKRGRSTAILAEVAERFGLQLLQKGARGTAQADGSTLTDAGSGRGRGGGVNVVINYPQTGDLLRAAQDAADVIGVASNV